MIEAAETPCGRRAPSPFRRIPTGIACVRADPGIAACGSGG